ncbi:IgGFc-binding protein-like [Cuculus canorus]|uniref:IgGFc-binding protein-like n=1 Tax=Cuculus canorus TaxID=55661 RepID=UPI0023AA3224|nr:IgGFc-binding protein-like [Cuculus canorus]
MAADSDVAVYYVRRHGVKSSVVAVPPLGDFCTSYHLQAPPDATIVLVANDGGGDVTMDGRPLGGTGWRRAPIGDLWWRRVTLGTSGGGGGGGGGGGHHLCRLNGTFGVLSSSVEQDEEESGIQVKCECDIPKSCAEVLCPPGTRCRLSSCRPRCEAVPDATCHLHRRVRTFSDASMALPIPCRYVLARSCRSDPSLPTPFSVEARILPKGISSLRIRVYNLTVTTRRGQRRFIQVNNQSFRLPVSFHGNRILLSRHGSGILFQTDFSLHVSYDSKGSTTISVPGVVPQHLCGLCADGFSDDDPGSSESFCERLAKGELFGRCRRVVEPWDHLEGCTEKPCGKESVCRALANYAAACAERGVEVPEWRREEGCAPSRPENTSTSSQETYGCNHGLAFLNGSCVATTSEPPGCHHDGHHYAPGQKVWAGDNCTQRCVCDGEEHRMRCREECCRRGERCRVEKEVVGCHPESYGKCSSGRDQSYVTFDGHRGGFGGRCLQEFVGTCEAAEGLVDFQVLVRNEGKRPYGVAVARTVHVLLEGHNVTLSHEFPEKAMVDGLLVHLPHVLLEGNISISRRGWGTSLITSFHLTISFDGQSHLAVTVPSSYSGFLRGLCGDFDGDPHNDVLKVVTTSTPGCEEPPPRPCSRLDVIARKQRDTNEECGLILFPEGPFRGCHSKVDPESFFQDCVMDYCVFRGHKGVVCQALKGYAAACQEVGVDLEEWRSKNVCAPSCPPHSHYQLNGTSCPTTCAQSHRRDLCDLPRTEGCFCDDGFLLNGDRCVPPWLCGCHHGGRYHHRGEEFYPEEGCSQRCRCTAEGTVTCWTSPCPPGWECRVENGVRGCHGGHGGRCVLLGRRRLVTFDGRKVTFGAECGGYVVAKVCRGGGQRLEVTVDNQGGVTVSVEGVAVTMKSGRTSTVDVDGKTHTLPLSVGDGKVWVFQEGNNVLLQTTFGHRIVSVDTVVLLVTIPTAFSGRMCGLCGDFDGNGDNDFLETNGKRITGIQELMETWKIPDESIPCVEVCPTCVVHPSDTTGWYRKETSCGMMVVTPGPFSGCHGKVDPEEFLEYCLQEMVVTEGAMDTLCRSLQAYTAACQEVGAPVERWRTETFCPFPCGSHSSYSLCAHSCAGGCARLGHRVPCHRVPCFEGCTCSEGFYSHGHRCVLPSTCGCFQDGHYLQVMENLLVDNCTQRCTCYLHGTLICEKLSSSSSAVGCDTGGGWRTSVAPGGP